MYDCSSDGSYYGKIPLCEYVIRQEVYNISVGTNIDKYIRLNLGKKIPLQTKY